MAACTLTLRSKVGQPVSMGPLNPSQKVAVLCQLSANYGGPGVGDTCDVSAYGGAVYSATVRGRVAIADLDLAIEPQVPADYDPANLVIRVVDASSGAEVAAAANLSGETFVLDLEMGA